MDEVIFFTPVEVDEYRSTDSVKILNSVVELRLTNQEEIVRQIAFKTYTSVIFLKIHLFYFNVFSALIRKILGKCLQLLWKAKKF